MILCAYGRGRHIQIVLDLLPGLKRPIPFVCRDVQKNEHLNLFICLKHVIGLQNETFTDSLWHRFGHSILSL